MTLKREIAIPLTLAYSDQTQMLFSLVVPFPILILLGLKRLTMPNYVLYHLCEDN